MGPENHKDPAKPVDVGAGGGNGAETHERRGVLGLALTALGVVYGDIGTSPLYALRECFHGRYAIPVVPENVLGVLSLIVWAFLLVVSVKYMVFLLRADLRGEGGILALTLLVTGRQKEGSRRGEWFLIAGIFGAALMCGDAAITPAISVLSAVEGLNRAAPIFRPYVVPLSLVILVLLFLFQRRGTARIGNVFGPVMLVWFATIAALGTVALVRNPEVLRALNPWWGVRLFLVNGPQAFGVLGSVFLVMTGTEALYADLGHFGRNPIRYGWFYVALPALLLNYFGQGAVLLASGSAAGENLFFELTPARYIYPIVILATVATIIASQAVITGAFSLARQAVQLGLWPRVSIVHTSAEKIGQVYVPVVNQVLLLTTIALVVGFRDSGSLASAYGIAVSATMLLTGVLFLFVVSPLLGARYGRWGTCAMGVFVAVDLAFLVSNCNKIVAGGWVALLFALVVYVCVATWRKGRTILRKTVASQALDIPLFVEDIARSKPIRVPGTAVFLSGNWKGVPRALLHNLKHNRVLHQETVILAVKTEEIPRVPVDERVEIKDYGEGIHAVLVKYGFSEDPSLPAVLWTIRHGDLTFEPARTTFFLGKETLVFRPSSPMALWRRKLFSFMSHNASNPALFFRLPPNRVVELGLQIEL